MVFLAYFIIYLLVGYGVMHDKVTLDVDESVELTLGSRLALMAIFATILVFWVPVMALMLILRAKNSSE